MTSASNGASCDGCPLSTSPWTFAINRYREGPHTITVVAHDFEGHAAAPLQWTVTVKRTDMGQEHNTYGF